MFLQKFREGSLLNCTSCERMNSAQTLNSLFQPSLSLIRFLERDPEFNLNAIHASWVQTSSSKINGKVFENCSSIIVAI